MRQKKENRGGARPNSGPEAKMDRDARIHVRVDDATIQRLKALARGWKCTASEAVRRAIAEAKA